MNTIRVWDPLVRVFHWSLAIGIAIAWLSANKWENLHYFAGYAAGGLILLRLVWGVLGSRYARFAQFVRHPRTVFSYLGAIAKGREDRYVGHNPAGGAMILALIITVAAVATSGWMQTTDAFWGVKWVQELHEKLADILLLLIVGHLAGVALASMRHRENLVHAMITGRKRAPDPDDIA